MNRQHMRNPLPGSPLSSRDGAMINGGQISSDQNHTMFYASSIPLKSQYNDLKNSQHPAQSSYQISSTITQHAPQKSPQRGSTPSHFQPTSFSKNSASFATRSHSITNRKSPAARQQPLKHQNNSNNYPQRHVQILFPPNAVHPRTPPPVPSRMSSAFDHQRTPTRKVINKSATQSPSSAKPWGYSSYNRSPTPTSATPIARVLKKHTPSRFSTGPTQHFINNNNQNPYQQHIHESSGYHKVQKCEDEQALSSCDQSLFGNQNSANSASSKTKKTISSGAYLIKAKPNSSTAHPSSNNQTMSNINPTYQTESCSHQENVHDSLNFQSGDKIEVKPSISTSSQANVERLEEAEEILSVMLTMKECLSEASIHFQGIVARSAREEEERKHGVASLKRASKLCSFALEGQGESPRGVEWMVAQLHALQVKLKKTEQERDYLRQTLKRREYTKFTS
eukprot:GDKJ01013350.1.p1 GENE.GDKJ01013350.1~~GDKJ01013350.1.p1  ORF type:complete len:478 (+),score=96.11 GDKJ01013350.1:81-1436(+)